MTNEFFLSQKRIFLFAITVERIETDFDDLGVVEFVLKIYFMTNNKITCVRWSTVREAINHNQKGTHQSHLIYLSKHCRQNECNKNKPNQIEYDKMYTVKSTGRLFHLRSYSEQLNRF